MADISKCSGNNCPIKESCRRYTAPSDKYQWFIEPPFKDGKCDMYWGQQNEYTMKQIKDILNGKHQ